MPTSPPPSPHSPLFQRHPALALACTLLLGCGLLCPPRTAHAQTPIYRCGNQYSQAPCAGGHAIADPLSTLHGSTQAAPGQTTVYLCQGQGGSQFWAREHCGQHHATIDRMETVPASLAWPQQVQQAQRQWDQARSLTAPAATQTLPRPSTRRNSEAAQWARAARVEQQAAQRDARHVAACNALQERLAELDNQGRAGITGAGMEQQRSARRKAQEAYRKQGC